MNDDGVRLRLEELLNGSRTGSGAASGRLMATRPAKSILLFSFGVYLAIGMRISRKTEDSGP